MFIDKVPHAFLATPEGTQLFRKESSGSITEILSSHDRFTALLSRVYLGQAKFHHFRSDNTRGSDTYFRSVGHELTDAGMRFRIAVLYGGIGKDTPLGKYVKRIDDQQVTERDWRGNLRTETRTVLSILNPDLIRNADGNRVFVLHHQARGEIDPIEYKRFLARGLVPISAGDYFGHDVLLHANGYLVLSQTNLWKAGMMLMQEAFAIYDNSAMVPRHREEALRILDDYARIYEGLSYALISCRDISPDHYYYKEWWKPHYDKAQQDFKVLMAEINK